MPPWSETQAALEAVARQQIFFIGGAPRSGTTWLQQMLNNHPEVSCAGEGFFSRHLAAPLDRMMAERRNTIAAKNQTLFQHTGGYALPPPTHADFLLGTGILLALHQQQSGKPHTAVGEKTPENVFLFPRLHALFPSAKFIGVARDPRDTLASGWHMFRQSSLTGWAAEAAKFEFIRAAMPPIGQGAAQMLQLARQFPQHCQWVTYEGLQSSTDTTLARLCRFLGVADSETIVVECVEQSRFERMSGGRKPGETDPKSFYRTGQIGTWRDTLTEEMNALILEQLGWTFPHFGWTP